jgi:hypothetical protein
MPIDIPKHIRAEAQRAEFFVELVKRADRLNSLEQAEADSLTAIEANRKRADEILSHASSAAQKDAAKAKAMLDAAKEKLASANEEAIKIIDKAGRSEELKKAKEKLAEINSAIEEAEKLAASLRIASEQKLAGLDAAVAVSEKKLSDINAAIAAIARR